VSLTGSVFLAMVAVVTAAGFVAVVAWWCRSGGLSSGRRAVPGTPGPSLWGGSRVAVGGVATRAGAVLGVNVLVLLLAAVVLNDQFGFFADWTDLAGTLGGGQQVSMAHGGTSAAAAAGRSLPGSGITPGNPATLASVSPGQRVLRYTVTGAHSGITAPVMVEVPAGYTATANASRRYPVLETFHGYPGTIGQWIGTMDLGSRVDALVAQQKLADLLIVSPSIEIPAGRDTECVNGPGPDPQLDTWLTQDVPDWVARTFRVRTDRAGWATIGLSTGGWCAAMAAMLHPKTYAAAIAMGGYFRPEFSAAYRPFPTTSPAAHRYDLIRLAHDAPPPVALWIQTSHADPVSYPSASQLLKQAQPPLSVTSVVLEHAGHRTTVWQDLLPQALQWLGTNVPDFHP
jgi:enterochelin esterase-like enzyme